MAVSASGASPTSVARLRFYLACDARERAVGNPRRADRDGPRPGNLPALLTRVVGRDGVISRLAEQLARRRFLTIVGPGGIGKTTVAVAVADRISASYKDGAWFVELAPLTDPNLVPSALCALLGITVSGVNPLSELTGWVSDKLS